MDEHAKKRRLATAQREDAETKRKALSEASLAAKAQKEEELAAADHEKQAISHTESRLSATERTVPFEEWWGLFNKRYDEYLWRVMAFTGDDIGEFCKITREQEEDYKAMWIRKGIKCGGCNMNLCGCDPDLEF